MSDDREYFWGRLPRRTYVSRRFGPGDSLRYFIKPMESEGVQFVTVDRQTVLRSSGAPLRKEIRATVTEDGRQIKTLTIQRFSPLEQPYERTHFSFIGDEMASQERSRPDRAPASHRDKQTLDQSLENTTINLWDQQSGREVPLFALVERGHRIDGFRGRDRRRIDDFDRATRQVLQDRHSILDLLA